MLGENTPLALALSKALGSAIVSECDTRSDCIIDGRGGFGRGQRILGEDMHLREYFHPRARSFSDR